MTHRTNGTPPRTKQARLKKDLGLWDVYAISTGAMFSSGFFLLPGLAAAKAGPAVVLAYLLAGILIVPAMLSKAELSTALPRAGGTYYFLDRSLGPMFGTVGGLGTYLALTLKTAFALIGIGAYAALLVDLPIKEVAIALTIAFVAINVMGAKETSGLQRVLVVILMTILGFFLAQGLFELTVEKPIEATQSQFEPFMPFGIAGLLSTIGFVFVSYAGLTKVASVAEEVQNPERNIPLGMFLSLASTTFVYVAGVFVLVAVLDGDSLRGDLTPVATAASQLFDWMPGQVGLILIVVAALAAFASTGNAGILSASRYPLAMARDRLLPDAFKRLGRFQTPTVAIAATGLLVIVFIVLLDEEAIAKLASTFQLLIFGLVNFAVIVMRESHIQSYDPGYRSPLYPWMQIAGIIVSAILIVYMGWLSILFTMGIVVICLVWYYQYAYPKVERDGAIYHWFARLGQSPHKELDRELREILKEKGLREDDPFVEVVSRAQFIEIAPGTSFESLIRDASILLANRLNLSADRLEEGFRAGRMVGATPVAHGAALPHLHINGIDRPELVLARSMPGLELDAIDALGVEHAADQPVHAVFVLVSPEDDHRQHLRLLAELANCIDEEDFMDRWLTASNPAHVKELLMRDPSYLTLRIRRTDRSEHLIGLPLAEASWPSGCLVALIRRGDQMIVPSGTTVLEEGDRITIIGEARGLAEIGERYPESH